MYRNIEINILHFFLFYFISITSLICKMVLNDDLQIRKYNCCRHGQAITPLQKVYEKSKLCNGGSHRIDITQSFSLLLLAAFIRLHVKKEKESWIFYLCLFCKQFRFCDFVHSYVFTLVCLARLNLHALTWEKSL